MSAFGEIKHRLLLGENLRRDEARRVMDELLSDTGPDDDAIAEFLLALEAKGVTEAELAGFAEGMRKRAITVELPEELRVAAVDTCGTGGSGLPTTNTSTLAAFIVAAGGVPVAKHGNRASSGKCGSMDLLEELGVVIDLGPSKAAALLSEIGITFLFAPRFHPAMRRVAGVRRSLGRRTVFNQLGPLCNPAGVQRQLLGVSRADDAPRMLGALAALGSSHVLVVHGLEGLDEMSLSGPTQLWELKNGLIEERRFEPAELGLSTVPFEALAGGERAANAELFMDLLEGRSEGARLDHACLNAAAGFVAAGRSSSLAQGFMLARQLVDSGAAARCFGRYRDHTRLEAA